MQVTHEAGQFDHVAKTNNSRMKALGAQKNQLWTGMGEREASNPGREREGLCCWISLSLSPLHSSPEGVLSLRSVDTTLRSRLLNRRLHYVGERKRDPTA